MIPEQVQAAVHDHPYPLIFATVSGAHLYGFPSPDSDWDLRGVHVLPVQEVVGLEALEETVELAKNEEVELDLVTHDLRKFITLMLRPNGYVLEQLLSPIVVHTTSEHAYMKSLAPACITRHHAYHYLGFAENQWKIFAKESPPRVKPLLYTFRVLLTGIHLMRSGEIEANLQVLNSLFKLPFLPELIVRKLEGAEKETLQTAELSFFEQEYLSLRNRLLAEQTNTSLQERPTAREALDRLLIEVRLKTMHERTKQT